MSQGDTSRALPPHPEPKDRRIEQSVSVRRNLAYQPWQGKAFINQDAVCNTSQRTEEQAWPQYPDSCRSSPGRHSTKPCPYLCLLLYLGCSHPLPKRSWSSTTRLLAPSSRAAHPRRRRGDPRSHRRAAHLHRPPDRRGLAGVAADHPVRRHPPRRRRLRAAADGEADRGAAASQGLARHRRAHQSRARPDRRTAEGARRRGARSRATTSCVSPASSTTSRPKSAACTSARSSCSTRRRATCACCETEKMTRRMACRARELARDARGDGDVVADRL